MATGPKIVHKQFNSPIGLYSQQNVQETLNKHLQNLDNGTVGTLTMNNIASYVQKYIMKSLNESSKRQ